VKGSPSKECRLYDPITIKLQKIQTNYGMESTMVLGGRQGEPGGRDYIGIWDTSRGWTFHSLAWRIPCTEEPGRLQSMESQRVRDN